MFVRVWCVCVVFVCVLDEGGGMVFRAGDVKGGVSDGIAFPYFFKFKLYEYPLYFFHS